MIRINLHDVTEHLEELIDCGLTVHITDDKSGDILAVLMPCVEYDDIQNEIESLKSENESLYERIDSIK